MEAAIVIVEQEKGIFVCEADGRPLWSKQDARGHCCVVTFADPQAAAQYLERAQLFDRPDRYRFVTVCADREHDHASPRALIRAGLFLELGSLAARPAPDSDLPCPPADPAPPQDTDPSSDRS